MPERLGAHQRICRKLSAKSPRNAFSSAEKRLAAYIAQNGGAYRGFALGRGDKLVRVASSKSNESTATINWHSNWRRKHDEMQQIADDP
jgi:hypothetical protein